MTHLQSVAKGIKTNSPTCSSCTEIHNISSINFDDKENEIKLQQRHQQSKRNANHTQLKQSWFCKN